MAVERAEEHPTFEVGGNTITSLAAPARGADEAALFRIDLPARGALPRHHHDHLDVFTVERGSVTLHVDEETYDVEEGDSAVVPIGAWHFFVAGDIGASVIVTMLGGTMMFKEDGSSNVPPWVS